LVPPVKFAIASICAEISVRLNSGALTLTLGATRGCEALREREVTTSAPPPGAWMLGSFGGAMNHADQKPAQDGTPLNWFGS